MPCHLIRDYADCFRESHWAGVTGQIEVLRPGVMKAVQKMWVNCVNHYHNIFLLPRMGKRGLPKDGESLRGQEKQYLGLIQHLELWSCVDC